MGKTRRKPLKRRNLIAATLRQFGHKVAPSRKRVPRRENGRRKGFEMQFHNHKDAKTRIETGFGGCFGGRRGIEAMVKIT